MANKISREKKLEKAIDNDKKIINTNMSFKTFYYIEKFPKKIYASYNDAVKSVNNLILDKYGIIQFLKFLYPLYNRTFLKNIKFGYSWDDGEKISLKYNENRTGYSRKNEELFWRILKDSLKKICINNEGKIFGVGNSGGLDSRVILYILNKLGEKYIGYTFGDISSDAVYIANKTAKILNFKNQTIEIEYDFFKKYWQIIIKKKPMYSLLYSWYFSALKSLPLFDVSITGFNGDNMLGSHLSNELIKIKKKSQLYRFIYDHYSMVSDNLLIQVLNDKSLVTKSYNDFLKNINNSENTKNENIFEEFNFKCRQLRFIINSINFDYCGNKTWYSPFCSKEFMNFALNLTFEERYHRKLYYNMARRYMKKLNKLRFERNYLSLNDKNYFKILIKKFFWYLDKKLKLKFYYKGSHKNVSKWIIQGNDFKYIKKLFNRPSKIFNEIFKTNFILNNLKLIFENNMYLFFNLLTIKLWIEENFKDK